MQTVLLAAAMLLSAGDPNAVPPPSPTGPDVAIETAPRAFPSAIPEGMYAGTARPYVPSIAVYYPKPEYDCYSHNHNRLDCYPGFCERHYRRPYNYRVKFDYPWHEDVYRNWPDACIGDVEMESPLVASARAMYSGAQRGGNSANQRANTGTPSPRAALGDAPLPRAKTLR